MRIQKKISGLMGLVLIVVLLSGCIVSATFVIVKEFSLAPKEGFYFYQVDLSTNGTWQDHRDEIDDIEAVGFEFYIHSSASGDIAFSVFVDDYSGAGADPDEVSSTADVVLDSLIAHEGPSKISYSKTVGLIEHLDRLKKLTKTGQFDVYTTSTGTVGSTFVIDSAKVIVTFSAG
jgi:hypothetical protein